MMGVGALAAGFASLWSARAVVMLREENEALKSFIKEVIRDGGGVTAVMERRMAACKKEKVQ